MTAKLFVFFALLGALVLVNVHGDDDFKEADNMDEVEDMVEVENDEESETRQPRSARFRFGGLSRRRRATGGGGGFGLSRRRRTPGGGGGLGLSRRRRTSGGGGGGTSTWTQVGTVVDIASLGVDAAQLILQQMSNVERKILITLGNKGEVDWIDGTVQTEQGSFIENAPTEIDEDEGVGLGAIKNTGPSATGVSGVVCYKFKLFSQSFCVMFKVPFSGDNYWNVKVYDGPTQASDQVYNDLQSGAIQAGTNVAEKKIWSGNGNAVYIKDCSMNNSGQAILRVFVEWNVA